jgi:hypothetical protein
VVIGGRSVRLGAWVLVGVSGLLVVNGLALFLVVVDTFVEQTVGLLLVGIGGLGLSSAVRVLRAGDAWAWRTTWIVAVTLLLVGVHTLRGDRLDVAILYLVLAASAIVGLLLTRPSAVRSGATGH